MNHIIGEYKGDTEDTSKMYVEAKEGTETASFYLNSPQINKVPPKSVEDYETIEITAPVVMVNEKMYINADGFTKGFNSVLQYNADENIITIQTLPYLVEYYKANITNYGYDEMSEDFNSQKALVNGMIIASKKSTGKFGVVNSSTKEEIISPRYNKIEYLEPTKEFIITNASEKVGIAYATGETKINVMYDEIKSIDRGLGYYLVKSNSKYGIINSKEELIIHIEYDEIGIKPENFPAEEIKNQYILYEKVIPVCLNKKWGLFDIDGKKLAEAEYDTIGCINTNVKDRVINNAMLIGDTGVIVVGKDELYGGISTKGDLIIPVQFEYIFSQISAGEQTYYIRANEKDYKAIDYIKAMKQYIGGYEEENNNNNNNNQENNNNANTTNTMSNTTDTSNTQTQNTQNMQNIQNVENTSTNSTNSENTANEQTSITNQTSENV